VDRTLAWRLHDGAVVGECTLAEASATAKNLGLEVPASVFAVSAAGEARLKAYLQRQTLIDATAATAYSEGSNSVEREVNCAFEALLFDPYPRPDLSLPGGGGSNGEILVLNERQRPLVAHSTQPLVPAEVCDRIVRECEDRAARLGGWTTQRHANYPTTDVSSELIVVLVVRIELAHAF
jgi:hypothetical protein